MRATVSEAAEQIYECDRCGACCRSHITEADIVDAIREPCIIERCKPLLGGGEPWMRMWSLSVMDRCPFLIADPDDDRCYDCEIYATRPDCCVTFPPGSKRCVEDRACFGIKPLPPARIVETPTGAEHVSIALRRFDDGEKSQPRPTTVLDRAGGNRRIASAAFIHNATRIVAPIAASIQARARAPGAYVSKHARKRKRPKRRSRR